MQTNSSDSLHSRVQVSSVFPFSLSKSQITLSQQTDGLTAEVVQKQKCHWLRCSAISIIVFTLAFGDQYKSTKKDQSISDWFHKVPPVNRLFTLAYLQTTACLGRQYYRGSQFRGMRGTCTEDVKKFKFIVCSAHWALQTSTLGLESEILKQLSSNIMKLLVIKHRQSLYILSTQQLSSRAI